MDVICTLEIKIESQHLEFGYIKDKLPYQNQDQDAKPSKKPTALTKAPNQDFKDVNVLCIFKTKIGPNFVIWVNKRPVTISK